MIITKKSDYAIRICRALEDGEIHNVTEICEKENVPRAFAYKILRELEMNDMVKSERGNKGGYYLNISFSIASYSNRIGSTSSVREKSAVPTK